MTKEKTIGRMGRITRIAATRPKERSRNEPNENGEYPREVFASWGCSPFQFRLVARGPFTPRGTIRQLRPIRPIVFSFSSLMSALGSLMPALQQNDVNRV